MSAGKRAVVICTYRVRKGQEDAFLELLGRHWPTLRKLGLVAGEPSQIYRGEDASGKSFFVEIFTWKDGEEGPRIAESTPEVMAVWEPMGALTEARLGRPSMEFPHVEPVRMAFAKV